MLLLPSALSATLPSTIRKSESNNFHIPVHLWLPLNQEQREPRSAACRVLQSALMSLQCLSTWVSELSELERTLEITWESTYPTDEEAESHRGKKPYWGCEKVSLDNSVGTSHVRRKAKRAPGLASGLKGDSTVQW